MVKESGIRIWAAGAGLASGLAVAGMSPAADAPKPLLTPAVIEHLTIDDAQRVLQDKGYRAERVTAQSPAGGAPYLKSQTGGSYFFVSLYDCADLAAARDCASLEFTSGAFSARPAPTGEDMARWNAENWWAFGVFDPTGAPYLRSYVSLAGGVTEAHLKAMIELWDWRVNEFSKFIQATAAGAASASGPPQTGVVTGQGPTILPSAGAAAPAFAPKQP